MAVFESASMYSIHMFSQVTSFAYNVTDVLVELFNLLRPCLEQSPLRLNRALQLLEVEAGLVSLGYQHTHRALSCSITLP